MAIKHAEEYRDAGLSRPLIERIRSVGHPVRIMEVCGTHTVSIFRSGVRAVLPDTITLLSGPGCPVCVTAQGEIDAFIQLARQPDVIVTTFGDLMRVPGSGSSLQQERAAGRDIRMVYSTFDALDIARRNPDRRVVFLGVGFETTAPTVAAVLLQAAARGQENFCVYSAHKLVPPALNALLSAGTVNVDGFLLPGHVSVIIGERAYRFLTEKFGVPGVIAGFEPTDLLQGIARLVETVQDGTARLSNAYPRAVCETGNPKALRLMEQAFTVTDAEWRGLGTIPQSGLAIRDDLAAYDAGRTFELQVAAVPEPAGCACGQVLTGTFTPPQCPLFRKACTPLSPVGPCMVSSEGTCAAWYRYHEEED